MLLGTTSDKGRSSPGSGRSRGTGQALVDGRSRERQEYPQQRSLYGAVLGDWGAQDTAVPKAQTSAIRAKRSGGRVEPDADVRNLTSKQPIGHSPPDTVPISEATPNYIRAGQKCATHVES